MWVCVGVCMQCTCVCVMCTCLCVVGYEGQRNFGSHFSGATHLGFKAGSLTVLVFTKQARVAGLQAPPPLPSPELLVCSITPVILHLCSGELTQVLRLLQQEIYQLNHIPNL